jgi:hypothetical protein
MKSKLGSQIVVGVLIIVVAIAACNSSTPTPVPPSPTSTPVSIAQSPTIHIGSASMTPDKTMKVCAGETVALTTNAQGTDLTYAWSVDGTGQLKHPGGKEDAGSSNRYTAPATTGQDVVKATTTDANNQSASDQVVISVVACSTSTLSPELTETPTCPRVGVRPLTKTKLDGTAQITSPKDCDTVGHEVPLSGTAPDLPDGEVIWILVCNTHGGCYPQSTSADDAQPIKPFGGEWGGFAYIGEPKTGAEWADIVVVLANQQASDVFHDRLAFEFQAHNYKGFTLAGLPDGIMEVDRITLHRVN